MPESHQLYSNTLQHSSNEVVNNNINNINNNINYEVNEHHYTKVDITTGFG